LLHHPTTAPTSEPKRSGLTILLVVGGVVYLAAMAAMATGPLSPAQVVARGQIVATVFLGIFIEATPFLLLGTLVSGAIQVLVAPGAIGRFSPRSPVLAALAGALLGAAFLPVCECGTVPATRRLLAKGAPPALGIAFLLAAPVINPVVIASTWIAFRGQPLIVAGRVGLTLLVAVLVGTLVGRRAGAGAILPPPAHDGHARPAADAGRLAAILRHTGDEFFEMARYLVVGATIAALFQAIVPREAILALGGGPLVSVLTMMALAAVLSICSTVDAFVALAFAGTFPPGALLAFLVFGPMIDLKSVLLFDTTFRRRTVAAIVALTTLTVAGATVAINLILARGA
jgi:uncharacterized protein